jgi:predicted transposase/invertase (TIGR01784 family)
MLTIEKLSADEEERVRAEYQEMMRRDYVSRINGAKREGHAEGIEQGRAEGIEQGRAEEAHKAYESTLAAARRMKTKNLSVDDIAECLGLTENEIAML